MALKDLPTQLRNRLQREEVYSKADYWDHKAEVYQGTSIGMWANKHLNRLYDIETRGAFERWIPAAKGLRVLDIGCGTGRLSRQFAERGAEVVGLDFSARSVDIARSQGPDGNPSYEVGSMLELTADEPYDAVVTWGSIAIACRHAGEVAQFFTRLRGVLKDDGIVVLLEPLHVGPLHRVLNMKPKDFVAIAERQGFRSLSTEPMCFWPTRVLLAYVPWPDPITRFGHAVGHRTMLRLGRGGDYTVVVLKPC